MRAQPCCNGSIGVGGGSAIPGCSSLQPFFRQPEAVLSPPPPPAGLGGESIGTGWAETALRVGRSRTRSGIWFSFYYDVARP